MDIDNKKKGIVDKIKSKFNDKKSSWIEKANWRKENQFWLRKSQSISLDMLSSMRRLNVSIEKLSEETNTDIDVVKSWVKGKHEFTIKELIQIEKVLEIQILR